MIKAKTLTVLSTLLIASSASWSMEIIKDDLDLKEGVIYKIKNKFSGDFLNGWGRELGRKEGGTATMCKDIPEYKSHATHNLWEILKKDNNNIKIKNFHSGHVLNGWAKEVGENSATMQEDVDNHENSSHHFWNVEENGKYYKIKNFYSGNLLSSNLEGKTGKGTAIMQVKIEDQIGSASSQLWSFLPIYNTLSMEDNKYKKPKYIKYIKEILKVENDIAIKLNNNFPIELMRKNDTSKRFDNYYEGSEIYEYNREIRVDAIACNKRKFRALLESRNFIVNEGQTIKVSCKINVRSGNCYLGLLNEKKDNWYSQYLENPISAEGTTGIHKIYLETTVPKGGAAASLMFLQYQTDTEKDKQPTIFYIKKLKISIENNKK